MSIANPSILMNYSSYHAHANIKVRNGYSFWGLQVKDVKKVNATRVGAMDWSMLTFPTIKSGKPMMMLDQKKRLPRTVSDPDFGRMVNDGFIFRQNTYIRSYEVGPDGTITMETIQNHLQEAALFHIKTIGILHDGYGCTPEMCKKNLIWVTATMQVVVDRYPVWGDVVQIDTWKAAFGKIGLCNNYTICDSKTGEMLIRASSIWVMMNKETRRLSRFPDEVRVELDQYLMDTLPLFEHDKIKWSKRDETIVDHVCKGLKPRWSDLDMNQHVNNVKYIGWILESVPKPILENYELGNMTLEYHRECKMDSVLQSHTFVIGTNNGKTIKHDHVDCEHLLELEVGSGRVEILKGRTRWRLKYGKSRGENNNSFPK